MNNKYNTTKREFFDFLIQEKNKTEETLKGLREKLIDYFFEGGNLQTSEAWKYVYQEIGVLGERVEYINKLLYQRIENAG